MSKIQPRTLSGFMELLPARQARFDRMVEILRETYSLYGFTPLDTPLIEASEVLLAKGGGETEKQIYRFMKGDTDLSLRFDLTVPCLLYTSKYSLCRSLIDQMGDELAAALPTEAVTDNGRFSPADRYQEIYDAVY